MRKKGGREQGNIYAICFSGLKREKGHDRGPPPVQGYTYSMDKLGYLLVTDGEGVSSHKGTKFINKLTFNQGICACSHVSFSFFFFKGKKKEGSRGVISSSIKRNHNDKINARTPVRNSKASHIHLPNSTSYWLQQQHSRNPPGPSVESSKRVLFQRYVKRTSHNRLATVTFPSHNQRAPNIAFIHIESD